MGGVLVNQDDAGFGLRHDVIIVKLRAGGAQRKIFGERRFGHRCGERHAHFKGGLALGEAAVGG